MNAILIETPKNIKESGKVTQKNVGNKHKKNRNSLNFLEVLLKELKSDKKKNLKSDISNKKDNIKEVQEVLKELLLNKGENFNQIQNLDNILNKINFDKEIVREIKNIITSNLKQQNRLLTQAEINEFKKINNIKDLIKFANKKELNIKKLTMQIAKHLKEKPKLLENIKNSIQKEIKKDKTSQNKNIKKLSTSQIISTKKEVKNSLVKVKENRNSQNKKVSITDILQNKETKIEKKIEKKDDNSISNKMVDSKIKNKNLSNNKTFLKNLIENSKNEIKTKEHHSKNFVNLNALLNSKKEKKIKNISNSQKNSIDTTPQINSSPINVNEIKARQVLAKETINHFKNSLDEAIKNYKPPISKVNIELMPKNLGKVEVSIIQRGNNITIHMNSDQNNLFLFQQHQAEFRQALSNIGFNNIDMNFNSNQEKERREEQAKKHYKKSEEEIAISDIEIEAEYRYA